MLIRYDKTADAKYITLLPKRRSRGVVARTKKTRSWLLTDYDSSQNIYGIEILNASKHKGTIVIVDNQVSFFEEPSRPHISIENAYPMHAPKEELGLLLSTDSYSLA